jgi:hypothetical protein
MNMGLKRMIARMVIGRSLERGNFEGNRDVISVN